jgi:hypothetical protein
MAHPDIDNRTPFVFEPLSSLDEQCRPLLVPIAKGTFRVSARGGCELADQQLPLQLAGECFGADPATSSYRYEPDVAFHKPATDVVFIGHAHAPRPGTREMLVDVSVAGLRRQLLVSGDRVWFRALGLPTISEPQPFERLPLVYERAFGGWDRSHPDPEQHRVELRNPVGRGFRSQGLDDGTLLPNLEDPRDRIRNPGDTPAPVGVGFTAPHWQPRARLAGSYDERWQKERSPLLPHDFDRRFFNAASPGLVAPGYLRGDERVSLTGMTPEGTLTFSLPGVASPQVLVARRRGGDVQLPLVLDTVIIEPDDGRIMLLWRGHLRLEHGPHDVTAVAIRH